MTDEHGLYCNCEECSKIRDLIFRKQIEGKAFLSGSKEDLERLEC